MKRAVALAALALVGCGAEDISDSSDDVVDAGTCMLGIEFAPVEIVAGPAAVVRANGNITGAAGFVTYGWEITLDGAPVFTTQAAADNRDVFFTAEVPGVYQATFSADGCPSANASFNATAPGAQDVAYRLRVQPPDGAALPASERVVVVSGGADASLGTIGLDDGLLALGTVTIDGAPTGAYLRAAPLSQPELTLEGFADAGGDFGLRAAIVPHQLLVVPTSPAVAPGRVESWRPQAPDLTFDAGQAIAATVLAPDGQPLVGARVALMLDGVPSTIGTTDGAGAVALRARFAGATDVDVMVQPTEPSPWPRLAAHLANVDPSGGVAVAYAPTLVAQATADVVLTRDGTPVAGAALALSASHLDVGTVTVDGVAVSASGTTLRRGVSAGDGSLGLVAVVAGSYLLAARDGEGAAVVGLEVDIAPPATVALPPPATMQLHARDAAGAPLVGVRGQVIAVGALAALGPMALDAVADADGRLAWADAPGGAWDLAIDDPQGRVGRLEQLGLGGAAFADVTLPTAVRLSGLVARSAGGAAISGAVITLYCADCGGIAAQRPIATAVSSPVGTFRLAVPDPGVAGP